MERTAPTSVSGLLSAAIWDSFQNYESRQLDITTQTASSVAIDSKALDSKTVSTSPPPSRLSTILTNASYKPRYAAYALLFTLTKLTDLALASLCGTIALGRRVIFPLNWASHVFKPLGWIYVAADTAGPHAAGAFQLGFVAEAGTELYDKLLAKPLKNISTIAQAILTATSLPVIKTLKGLYITLLVAVEMLPVRKSAAAEKPVSAALNSNEFGSSSYYLRICARRIFDLTYKPSGSADNDNSCTIPRGLATGKVQQFFFDPLSTASSSSKWRRLGFALTGLAFVAAKTFDAALGALLLGIELLTLGSFSRLSNQFPDAFIEHQLGEAIGQHAGHLSKRLIGEEESLVSSIRKLLSTPFALLGIAYTFASQTLTKAGTVAFASVFELTPLLIIGSDQKAATKTFNHFEELGLGALFATAMKLRNIDLRFSFPPLVNRGSSASSRRAGTHTYSSNFASVEK